MEWIAKKVQARTMAYFIFGGSRLCKSVDSIMDAPLLDAG